MGRKEGDPSRGSPRSFTAQKRLFRMTNLFWYQVLGTENTGHVFHFMHINTV